jgi:PadR family transcriptional regulator PadR
MNGVPELLILRLVGDREMYGYEIVQAIKDRTGNAIALGEGVIYPVLHVLEREGALKASRKTVGGRSRIYYAVTPEGSRRLTELAGTWTRLTDAIQSVFVGGAHAEAV